MTCSGDEPPHMTYLHAVCCVVLCHPDVMESRRTSYPLPPAQGMVEYTTDVQKRREERDEQFHLPWYALVGALVAALMYQQLVRVVSLGALVPVVNITMFFGILYYFYYFMLNE